MPEEPNKPRRIALEGSTIFEDITSYLDTLGVISADTVRVEPSVAPRFLRLRSGDVQFHNHVWLRVNDQWYDITLDRLPDDET